ncbi:hypothetical protein L0666_00075 [Octadecabacter sp. CECT 8868]|uniref:hypothetical protein n=1 Tax=Octadecabacter algicola TaxID=2909342 RepID=UPI001F3D553A|nr:hypothetical protein [Octadecabacter algicola]MCF2903369.1 hypothetical protein [Octadecabacter algicola]
MQNVMSWRHKDLARFGIVYPQPELTPLNPQFYRSPLTLDKNGTEVKFDRNIAGHGTLFLPYCDPSSYPPKHDRAEAKNVWDQILTDFRTSDMRAIVISAETPFFENHSMDLAAIAGLFSGLDLTLTVGLRHPIDLLQGLFATDVANIVRASCLARDYPVIQSYRNSGYAEQISRIAQGLGITDVRPFYAEDLLWKGPRSMLGGFLEHVGLDVDIEQDFHSRPTPPPEEVLFLRDLNSHDIEHEAFGEISKAIANNPTKRTYGKTGSKPCFFPKPMQALLDQRYRIDMDEIAQNWGLAPQNIPPFEPRRAVLNISDETRQTIAARLMPNLSDRTSNALHTALKSISAN